MSIHQRIRERRLALGLTSHDALAKLIGVSWQTVQLWEKEGGTAPNRSRMPAVAKALNTTPEWLLNGTGPEVAGEAETRPKVVALPATPPKWIDAEAYKLVELYFLADSEGRERIMRLAQMSIASAKAANSGNES